MPTQDGGGCGGDCGCGPALPRRAFLGSLAAGGAALVCRAGGGTSAHAIAGPFALDVADDFPVPADKKFSAAWLRSLVERGEPLWYSSASDELKHIGMPIGGIGTGQVYLGGDGRLWHWDISNVPQESAFRSTSGPHYAKPAPQRSPFAQGFAIEIKSQDGNATARRTLDARGFRDIRFRGEYPIARVEYRDVECPFEVDLEAFSPFCPLDADGSSLPAIIMRYVVRNPTAQAIDATVAGWLENPVCLTNGVAGVGELRNRANAMTRTRSLTCDAIGIVAKRADIVVADFEDGSYAGWTSTGSAFGAKPRHRADIVAYQGDVGMHGEWTVNTHESRHGENVVEADRHLGTLTGPLFRVERDWLRFRIGGGNHPGQTCVNLLVDGAPVRTATGHDNNRMRVERFDVREFADREVRLQIVDGWSGGWGQIGADQFVLSDSPLATPLEESPEFGTMSLAVLDQPNAEVRSELAAGDPSERAFEGTASTESRRAFGTPLIGAVRATLHISPGESREVSFVLAWHFPRLGPSAPPLPKVDSLRRRYARLFLNSDEVLEHVADHFDSIPLLTRRWRDTWYDSTLPLWLLDRTMMNASTLATATCLRLTDEAPDSTALDRFYGWEGTYCCAGTCQHVWQYAQSVARLFPSLERNVRETVDFGIAWHESGAVDYRAEADRRVAHDGLAGTIVRVWREHTMCPDDGFLRRVWPRVKASVEYLLREDKDEDGILEGAQYNTLDTTWYGPMAWISSLYLAAVRAGEAMATAMGDAEFAKRCTTIVERGSKNIVATLFNGEWFIHKADLAHPEANNTNDGCHIDQVFGQSMLWQVGLPRVVPEAECKTALTSLYKYAFAPDIGPYRQRFDSAQPGGRWYAMPGEGGLLMCTWPPHRAKDGAAKARGKGNDAWAAGYFVECMSGFEHQVASHMVWEGLVEEGLAIERMIHDRYHASKRNPFNEVECSDHYARAMASHGVFIAACGFECNGPEGHLGFAPRLTPEHFRCPFVAAEGWGTFEQRIEGNEMVATIAVRYGSLRLRTLALAPPRAVVSIAADSPATVTGGAGRATVRFASDVVVRAGETMRVTLRMS